MNLKDHSLLYYVGTSLYEAKMINPTFRNICNNTCLFNISFWPLGFLQSKNPWMIPPLFL